MPASGSPLLFQQKMNNIPTLNPLLQPPTSVSHLPSPLIQPSIRPLSVPSAFQAPPSAFTPLNPANTQQTSSLIQPKLTLGNQQPPLVQPVPFSAPRMPTAQGIDTTPNPSSLIIPPPTQDFPTTQYDSQLAPPPPPPSATTMKDPNPTLPPPPPPHQSGAGKEGSIFLGKTSNAFRGLAATSNPYSARASLTERIYPSMPTSQAPLQPQQLPPPMSFQQQQQQQVQQTLPPVTSNLFIPPPTVVNSTGPNVYSGYRFFLFSVKTNNRFLF